MKKRLMIALPFGAVFATVVCLTAAWMLSSPPVKADLDPCAPCAAQEQDFCGNVQTSYHIVDHEYVVGIPVQHCAVWCSAPEPGENPDYQAWCIGCGENECGGEFGEPE